MVVHVSFEIMHIWNINNCTFLRCFGLYTSIIVCSYDSRTQAINKGCSTGSVTMAILPVQVKKRWRMGLLPDIYNYGLRVRRECRERFSRYRLQRKPLVNDPSMHAYIPLVKRTRRFYIILAQYISIANINICGVIPNTHGNVTASYDLYKIITTMWYSILYQIGVCCFCEIQ